MCPNSCRSVAWRYPAPELTMWGSKLGTSKLDPSMLSLTDPSFRNPDFSKIDRSDLGFCSPVVSSLKVFRPPPCCRCPSCGFCFEELGFGAFGWRPKGRSRWMSGAHPYSRASPDATESEGCRGSRHHCTIASRPRVHPVQVSWKESCNGHAHVMLGCAGRLRMLQGLDKGSSGERKAGLHHPILVHLGFDLIYLPRIWVEFCGAHL